MKGIKPHIASRNTVINVRPTGSYSRQYTWYGHYYYFLYDSLYVCGCIISRPLHTQDWEPVTITLQALSLVKKTEPVQVRFHTTLEGPTEYVNARWMHSNTVYMDSYMALNGSCFTVTWIVFKNHLLKVGLTQNPGDHGTPNAHNYWFVLFLSWVRTRINKKTLK
jgi:hypothetical protein